MPLFYFIEMEVEEMAGVALSTIGVKFGYGLGSLTEAPSTWKEIEECVSISGVEVTKDKIDVTPLSSKRKKYVGGHEDTGGELTTKFNESDEFDKQWDEMLSAYKGKGESQVMWFCAYHPSRKKMDVYIVEPGSRPATAYEVGNALQVEIKNTLIDLPDPVTAVEPTVGP